MNPPATAQPQLPIESALAFLRALLISTRDPQATVALAKDTDCTLDGDALRQLIERERVGPLLHRALLHHERWTPATRAALRNSHRATALRNLLLLHELDACLQQLAAAQIAVIVLKGAALAQPVYGSLALRPMVDVDILIHRRDLAAARAIIEGLGFRPLRLETHPGVLVEHENELAFTKRGAVPVELDLHWCLIDSPFYQRALTMEWFWHSARVQSLGNFTAATLGPEALLIHLCAHLMLHHRSGSRLLWWHDIAEVLHVERDCMDWEEVFARSRTYHLVLPMREVLTHLAAEWHAPIPADILQRFVETRPSRAEADIFARHSGEAPAGQRFWSDLRSMASWRQALQFARTNLVPSAAYMRGRYGIRHPWLVPLYYPYRWLRGLRDAGRPSARGD